MFGGDDRFSPACALLRQFEPSVSSVNRREVGRLAFGVLAASAGEAAARSIRSGADSALSLNSVVQHPLLYKFYSRTPAAVMPDGAAGLNKSGFRTIEEQRQGTEWIIRGVATARRPWIDQGWMILDRGIASQQLDGGFGRWGGFHSTALFVEGLARACLLDPPGARVAGRLEALGGAVSWLIRSDGEILRAQEVTPYTHRNYILAAGLGQAASVLNLVTVRDRAVSWARRGIDLQRSDGVNPERGGYDVSYQLVGVLHALRYLPECGEEDTFGKLRRMIQKAIRWELRRLKADGMIDAKGSTRTGVETFGGVTKGVNYSEAFEAFSYGSLMLRESWTKYAIVIGAPRKWV